MAVAHRDWGSMKESVYEFMGGRSGGSGVNRSIINNAKKTHIGIFQPMLHMRVGYRWEF